VSRGLALAALVLVGACGSIARPPAAALRAPAAVPSLARSARPKGAFLTTVKVPPIFAADADEVIELPPERELPMLSLALVAGGWRGGDDDAYAYDLDIAVDGSFTQVVYKSQRDGGAICLQTGVITVSADRTELIRTFDDDECNHEYDHKAVNDAVVRLDDRNLEVQTESSTPVRYLRTR